MCGLFDAACAVPGYAPSVLRRFRQEFDAAIYAPEPAAALPQRGRGIAEPAQRTPYFLLLQARAVVSPPQRSAGGRHGLKPTAPE